MKYRIKKHRPNKEPAATTGNEHADSDQNITLVIELGETPPKSPASQDRQKRPESNFYLASQWALVILTLGGIYIAIRSLNTLTDSVNAANRQAAAAATQAIAAVENQRLVKRNFEISEQPYVSLGRKKDGVIGELVLVEPTSKPSNALVGLNIYLNNGGRGPALTPNVRIMIGATYVAKGATPSKYAVQPRPELQTILRWHGPNDTFVRKSVDTPPILPDSDYVHYTPDQFTQEQAMALLHGERFTMLMGMFEYCDEFGNYFCRQFALVYQPPPSNRFVTLGDGFDCSNWYGYPPRQPDQVYLSPCEQPDERDTRQKQEREREIKAAAEAPLASPTPSPTATATPTKPNE